MQIVSIVIGVIVLIVGVGYFATNSGNTSAPATTVVETNQAAEEAVTPETSPEPEVATEAGTPQIESTEADETTIEAAAIPTTPGTYQTYDAAKIAASDAEYILLFFHATWCPSCRALDADITANAAAIPPGVEIYKIDYDTATELKRQYGVTRQHSIIEITAAGVAESSVSHPSTLAGILATI